MIDGLISGRLFGAAAQRTGGSGKRFVTCKVRAASGEEGVFVNVIAFSVTAGDALLALADGDSVALAGSLTPKVWTDKHGEAHPALDIVAHQVLTVYHLKKRRAAVQGDAAARPGANPSRRERDVGKAESAPAPAELFDDELEPF